MTHRTYDDDVIKAIRSLKHHAAKLEDEYLNVRDLGYGPLSKKSETAGRSTTRSDPTGDTVASKQHERIRRAVAVAAEMIDDALKSADAARRQLSRAKALGDPPRHEDKHVPSAENDPSRKLDVPEQEELLRAQRKREGVCINCGQDNAVRDDRCWPCYQFKRRTGEERPQELADRRRRRTG